MTGPAVPALSSSVVVVTRRCHGDGRAKGKAPISWARAPPYYALQTRRRRFHYEFRLSNFTRAFFHLPVYSIPIATCNICIGYRDLADIYELLRYPYIVVSDSWIRLLISD